MEGMKRSSAGGESSEAALNRHGMIKSYASGDSEKLSGLLASKHSSIRTSDCGDSGRVSLLCPSKSSSNWEGIKKSLTGGDSKKLSSFQEEVLRQYHESRALELERMRKGKVLKSKEKAEADEAEEKPSKKSKTIKGDEVGVKKLKKVVPRYPNKYIPLEEKGEAPEKDEEDEKTKKEKPAKKGKKKLSISISLMRGEIEEDFFGLTGAKPPRRPKRRAKNVQKQFDMRFPGLQLHSITAETYKVSENSKKN